VVLAHAFGDEDWVRMGSAVLRPLGTHECGDRSRFGFASLWWHGLVAGPLGPDAVGFQVVIVGERRHRYRLAHTCGGTML